MKDPNSKELIEPILSDAFVETERRLHTVGGRGGTERWGGVGWDVVGKFIPEPAGRVGLRGSEGLAGAPRSK